MTFKGHSLRLYRQRVVASGEEGKERGEQVWGLPLGEPVPPVPSSSHKQTFWVSYLISLKALFKFLYLKSQGYLAWKICHLENQPLKN